MMDSETAPATTIVPIKVPAPDDHAPPTLAEPASGPVAEMSGALQSEEEPVEATATETAPSTNGETAGPASSEDKPTVAIAVPSDTAPPAESATPAPETAATETAPPAEADATLSSSKKLGNGKRKSTGGVPEHKNKKLNKKKSMPKLLQLDAKPGEHFIARLKSYPPWPSIICDEEMLPATLLHSRPVTTKRPDGTYTEPYADGGKKVADRTFPIMFLHTNEFAWIPNHELTPIKPEDFTKFQEKGKGKALAAAYQIAEESHNLEYYKEVLREHARALQEDEETRAAREAEKAAKAEKKKRKSEVAVADDDDDVDMEDVDTADAKKANKKRKKVAEDGDEEEKPAKTPKTTKLKLTSPKDPATAEKKAKEPKATKAKAEKRKSKVAEEDEDVEMNDDWATPRVLDPVEERKSREKEVLFLRHKLQKGFLSRDQAPQESEMLQMSHYIKKLEHYEDLEVGIIRATKINKVLKALIKLNTIPKDEEFDFRGRAVVLLGQWNKLLGAEPDAGDDKADANTNGIHDDKEEKTETVEPSIEKTEPELEGKSTSPPKAESETKAGPAADAIKPETVKAENAAPSVEDVKPAEHQTLGISMKSPDAAEPVAPVATDGPVTAEETDARTATKAE